MFGFLRRKKDKAPVAEPPLAPPAEEDRPAAAADAHAPAAEVASPDAEPQPTAGAGSPSPTPAAPATPPAAQAPAMPSPPVPDVIPSTMPVAAEADETALADPVSDAAEVADERRGWFGRLKQGLSKTRANLTGLFVKVTIDEALFEDLETALLASDAGFETTEHLLEALRARVRQQRLTEGEQVRQALRALLVELLTPLEKPIDIDAAEPLVVMIAGVNGAGKTTSIGKLAHHLQREGKSVLLAAGDTFRAAAREQLAEWGSRNNVQVIAQSGGDPAAVAFDAVNAGIARRTGVVMIDTAGRLPTQTHLMQELTKIRRVVAKARADAPHEVLLVLDGNTGQNMLAQVKAFDDAVSLTGLVVTKLDGTAKGGALAALAHLRRDNPVPVYFIGVGEGIEDLQAFSAREFAAALVG